MNEKTREIFNKYAGNSMIISCFNAMISQQDFEKAEDFLINELNFEEKDAIYLVNYYKESLSKSIELVEITKEEVKVNNFKTNEIQSYLFLYGGEMIQSTVTDSYGDGELSFFSKNSYSAGPIQISKAKQIWKLIKKED
ncbi:hypothetical protein GW796_07585 [archaeon]|nr:hypothetical protein [archaeon]